MAGKPVIEVVDAYPSVGIRYLHNLDKLRSRLRKAEVPRFRELEVIVFYGETGQGKTKRVHDETEDGSLYIADLACDGWWDNYDGEEVVLIDDFYGQIPISKMLRILDRYRLQLPVKGGSCWAEYKKVYITSNDHPDKWWPNVDNPEVKAAIKRRITRCVHFVSLD